ncbi:MAK10-like protein [Tanacetum coccineum]|uniref:MAK10-like protein n=1 Tax=Tanacetum coccineum TaxID=301880 RepID=A0ABQ4XYG6_9ASTR
MKILSVLLKITPDLTTRATRTPFPKGNNVEDLTSRFLAQFFPPRRTAKLHNDILMFIKESLFLKHGLASRTYSKKSLIMASIFGSKSKSFMIMSIPPQDEPLTNWPVNDLRDFAKPVKAISLPHDVPSTSDRRLIELENQVQRLMEAHLAPKQPIQVNKITSSCEICIGPHDTQYCMETPEQTFVDYASSRTDEAGGKWYTFKPKQNNLGDTYNPSWKSHPNLSLNNQSNLKGLVSDFMAYQDARLSKFEADFKQQQSEMTNKIDTVLKAITDQITGTLPSDTGEVSAKIEDPGLFTLPCRLGDSKPFGTLADLGSCVNIIPLYLFKKLNIRLLEETDHIFGLADGTKSYPVGIVKDVEVHIGRLKLLNDFYVIDMKKDPETHLLVGRGFLATANIVIDCRKVKIVVGEGITRSVFGVTEVDLDGVGVRTPYYDRKDFLDCHLPGEWEIARDAEINPFKDVLESEDLIDNPINWDKPPKNGYGAWYAKIKLIDPDGEEFTKTLQSIPTSRKLSERESPREIINLDHFYDT